MEILADEGSEKTKPNKANLFRIEYCVMRIAKSNLKKQSQFMKGQNERKYLCNKGL